MLFILFLTFFSVAFATAEGLDTPIQTETYSELNILNEHGFLPDGALSEDEKLTNPELAEILNTAFNRFIAMGEHTKYQTEENKIGEETFNYFTNLPLVEQKNTWDVMNKLLQDYKNDQTVIPNDLAMRIEQTLAAFDLNEPLTEQSKIDKNGMYFNLTSKDRHSFLDNSVWTMPVMTASNTNSFSPLSSAIESRLNPTPSKQNTILGVRPVQDFEYAVKVALGDFRLYGGINVESTQPLDFANIISHFEHVNKASVGVQFNIFENRRLGVGGVLQYNVMNNNKVEDENAPKSPTSSYGTGITTGFIISW